VEVVGVEKREAPRRGEPPTDRRLARSRDTHHDDDLRHVRDHRAGGGRALPGGACAVQ
jgi:hypothetical protein